MPLSLSLNYVVHRRDDVTVLRHDLADKLTAIGMADHRVADAMVMLSELTTNVFAHTGSEADVTVSAEGGELLVAIRDRSDAPPILRPVDPAVVGGNGLRIVDALADSWGTADLPDDGKVVWFALSLV